MNQNPAQTQAEPRTSTVTVAMTAAQKDDVVFLSKFRRCSESDIMKSMTMDQILEEVARIRAIHEVA